MVEQIKYCVKKTEGIWVDTKPRTITYVLSLFILNFLPWQIVRATATFRYDRCYRYFFL